MSRSFTKAPATDSCATANRRTGKPENKKARDDAWARWKNVAEATCELVVTARCAARTTAASSLTKYLACRLITHYLSFQFIRQRAGVINFPQRFGDRGGID